MKIGLLSILAIIFVAGCIGGGTRPTTVSDTEGVRISSFTATPSVTDVLSGDTVIFDVEVENIGGTTASAVEVTLFGIENQWRETSGVAAPQVISKSFQTLRPPQAERNVAGDFRVAQWEYMTPRIPEGLRTPLNIEARVTYDYNTNGFLQLTAVNDEEYRRQQVIGSSIDPPVVQNSAGPLQLSVPSTEKSNFIIVDTASTEPEFIYPLKIEFRNVGAGFPMGTDSTDQGRLTGTISLLGPGVEFSSCLGVTSGREVTLQDSGVSDVIVKLRDTQNVPIVCNLKFTTSDWQNRPTDKVSLVFDIDYTYFTKQTATVNVLGRRTE